MLEIFKFYPKKILCNERVFFSTKSNSFNNKNLIYNTMKKATIIISSLFLFTLLFSTQATAQKFSDLDVSPLDIASYPSNYKDSNKKIKIIYSRPQLKGRSLDQLAPNGKIWRTGANEAAELILYADFYLGKTLLKAGTYTLATIPGENEWTIIVNSDLNTWGAYFYNEANDVARISVPVTRSNSSIEAFSIAFAKSDGSVDMYMAWDTLQVKIPFKN